MPRAETDPADRPAEPATGKPSVGKPAAGKPAAGKPAAGKPDAGKSAAGTPAAGKPGAAKSRRRPVKTTGTFPPEGSAAAADRSHPVPVRQWPIVVVLALVAMGLAVTALDAFRPGVITIGVALLLGCALRAILPEVGMLAVRSRFTDIAVMGVLGTAIIVLALASEPDPVITLPFVNDISRFLGIDSG